jgi:hypothetical protein
MNRPGSEEPLELKDNLCIIRQTWCTREKRQGWDDRIWRDDSVVGNFCAILDYRELAL